MDEEKYLEILRLAGNVKSTKDELRAALFNAIRIIDSMEHPAKVGQKIIDTVFDIMGDGT